MQLWLSYAQCLIDCTIHTSHLYVTRLKQWHVSGRTWKVVARWQHLALRGSNDGAGTGSVRKILVPHEQEYIDILHQLTETIFHTGTCTKSYVKEQSKLLVWEEHSEMSNWGYDELLETMEATCWCVEHNNRWVSLSADGGIICTEDSPTGEGKAMCIEWFAAQNLLEYKDLITSVDHSCNNLDANWPVTLVQTAEAIDVLSKILTNFMGKEHEVGRFMRKNRV